MDSEIGKHDYVAKLKGILKSKGLRKYDKSNPTMYSIFSKYGDQSLAVKHAEKLEEITVGRSSSDKKPSTSIYRLVQTLNHDLFTKS